MVFKSLPNKPSEFLKNSGWDWTLQDTNDYITNQLVVVTEKEVEDYYNAAAELYEMYIHAAEYVIENKLYDQIGIPSNCIPIIEYSWNNDQNWHLYGRFDLSGGLDGQPIKLIEFNADTATCIPETAIIQWAALMANDLSENQQFNSLYEDLTATFQTLKSQNSNLHPSLLLTLLKDYPEDYTNVEVIAEAAQKAGFETHIAYIDEIEFSKDEGVFVRNENNNSFSKYDFLFKLIPWEFIAWDEPQLLSTLTDFVVSNKINLTNPAYTLLFQSKGLLKILWDLYPNHPLLLETSFSPLYGKKAVKKVFLGREGANVTIVSPFNTTLFSEEGDYQNQNSIYQEYTPFVKDDQGSFYQAGVFFSSRPCGLGFRKGGEILNNKAQFCGHTVVNE